jgi:hypothetical protein
MVMKQHERSKSYFQIAALICCIGVLWLLNSGCANIIPPEGGPRDTTAPVLVTALPKDSTIAFNAKKIVLTFNEYVTVDDIQKNLLVNPLPQQSPIVESKLRNVTVLLKDSLLANTTYSINFGQAIKDVNEGNPIKNYTYVFTTGNTIDNGTLSGRVVLAKNGKTDSALLVVLHKNLNDSAIKKLRPNYVAKLNGKGYFEFKHLPQGPYKIYIVPDDYNKRYDDSTKMFAFYDTTVTAGTDSLKLYAYQQYEKEDKPANANNNKKPKTPQPVKYTTNFLGSPADVLQPIQFEFSQPLKQVDTAAFILTDTNFVRLPQFSVKWDSLNKVSITHALKTGSQYRVVLLKQAVVDTANQTLAKADTLKVATRAESDYGALLLRFSGVDIAKKPVLQLLQNDKLVIQIPITGSSYKQRLFVAGEFEMNILYDTNGNMRWDTGNFATKQQPEKVIAIERKLVVRANYDNEAEIKL